MHEECESWTFCICQLGTCQHWRHGTWYICRLFEPLHCNALTSSTRFIGSLSPHWAPQLKVDLRCRSSVISHPLNLPFNLEQYGGQKFQCSRKGESNIKSEIVPSHNKSRSLHHILPNQTEYYHILPDNSNVSSKIKQIPSAMSGVSWVTEEEWIGPRRRKLGRIWKQELARPFIILIFPPSAAS